MQRNHLEGTKAVKPTPPNVTLDADDDAAPRGRARSGSCFLGRGHTAGDVVVYLPKERVVATGDLLVEARRTWATRSSPSGSTRIEALKKLDFDTVLPGHGSAFKGKAKLDHWQAYLRDFWAQAQKFHKAGVPWEEAAKQVDLRAQRRELPHAIRQPPGITPNHGMLRAVRDLDGKTCKTDSAPCSTCLLS